MLLSLGEDLPPVYSCRITVIFLNGLVFRKSFPFGSFLNFPFIGQNGMLLITRVWKTRWPLSSQLYESSEHRILIMNNGDLTSVLAVSFDVIHADLCFL